MDAYNTAAMAGIYHYPVPYELTRDGLRADAVFHTPVVQQVIRDLCDSSERLEQIGAMSSSSGLQYWVQDSVTGVSLIVAECVWLLELVPQYMFRVPHEVRLAYEALNTVELRLKAKLHSLSNYLKYIDDWQASQALQAQGQTLQPSLQPPTTLQQLSSTQPSSAIVLSRTNLVAIDRGSRSSGIRQQGTGVAQYEWPKSRKLAWLLITPRIPLPSRATVDSYCPFQSVGLWDHVDVRLIGPNIEVNLVEIVAFFPRAASTWRALWKRFEASDWTLPMLRMLIFYLYQLGTAALGAHKYGSMKKHRIAAQNHPCAAAGFLLDNIATDRVSSNIEFSDLRDCFLYSLGDDLVHWPEGPDRGILTIAVRHARSNGHNNVRLSQIEQYISQERLDMQYVLPGPSTVPVVQADEEARERLFPEKTYNWSLRNNANYDVIKKWWKAGGYHHND